MSIGEWLEIVVGFGCSMLAVVIGAGVIAELLADFDTRRSQRRARLRRRRK